MAMYRQKYPRGLAHSSAAKAVTARPSYTAVRCGAPAVRIADATACLPFDWHPGRFNKAPTSR